MYPAVAKNGNVDNVALRPSMAERALKLKEAKIIHIDTVEGETIGGVILADLVEVGADRTLTWKFRSQNSTTIPSGVSYGAQPGERLRVQESGELTIGGKRYRLEPGFLLEVNDQAVIVRDLRGQIVEPTADEAYTWTFSLKQETAQS
jgi:hypothetical protein